MNELTEEVIKLQKDLLTYQDKIPTYIQEVLMQVGGDSTETSNAAIGILLTHLYIENIKLRKELDDIHK